MERYHLEGKFNQCWMGRQDREKGAKEHILKKIVNFQNLTFTLRNEEP